MDEAGIVEQVSWAESVAVASFRPTTWCGKDDLRGYAAEALVLLADRYDGRGTFRGFLRYRLKFTITDLLRRDFGRTSVGGWRSAASVQSIEADRERPCGDWSPGAGSASEPPYLACDPHIEDRAVDGVYARAALDVLDRSRADEWVLAESVGGRTMMDLGRELGVTESRACQLRKLARRRLLARLGS